MKNYICHIILFFVTLPLWSYSQNTPAAYAVSDEYTIWNLSVGDSAYVYADNAYLRDYPGLNGNIIDSVAVGTTLIVHSPAYNSSKIKGFSAPWQEVTYQKEGQTKRGFIWLGLLALGRQQDSSGYQYLYGYERFFPSTESEPDYYSCAIKRLNPQQQLVAKFNFRSDYQGQLYTTCKILPSMGLDGLQQIFRVAFVGEACGIPSYYHYAGWNGKNFVELPARYSVSDAGVFYYDEQIQFPSEHQKEKNIIYKNIEEGEVVDENADEPDYKINKRQEKYRWDGQRFSQVQENK